VLCAKSYKIKKIGLKPLRKKIRSSSSSSGGCEFFSKQHKGHRRCPLLAAATVGIFVN